MLDLNKFQSRLETKLKLITTELNEIANYNESTDNWEAIPEIDNNFGEADINVEADAVESWNERRSTVSALETEYQNSKRALAKIKANTFGLCEVCGEPIEESRIDFSPTARTCSAHMNEEDSTLSL